MMATTATQDRPLTDALRRAGNPFRNYFARNPDDEVCARFHVPELFAAERDLLHAIIDLYRTEPTAHSEVVPVLGNKGAGKTHLLHSIKHGAGGQWQLLVTPGVYQKDSDFLEYLLFQIIDTLLGGGKQKGGRPLAYVGDQLVRHKLAAALRELSPEQKMDLFPPPGLGKWGKRLGLGASQAAERADWLIEAMTGAGQAGRDRLPLLQALADAGLGSERAFELLQAHAAKTESRNTAGIMRKQVFDGFAEAILRNNEADLANFLTYGFAELDFQVRPTRQDLVLALFKVLGETFRELKIPVVVAFDQLEDLLLARRSDDAHKTAEAFFAGIVQAMHQIHGLCFLIFAERGLWNRFVPSLDGYIRDRLNNPVHVPGVGTLKALRLEAPPAELVRRVAEARLRPVLDACPEAAGLPDLYPFTTEQVERIARTEPTLRDMLQQFRHLFDHVVYGPEPAAARPAAVAVETEVEAEAESAYEEPAAVEIGYGDEPSAASEPHNRIQGIVTESLVSPLPTAGPEAHNRVHALLGNEPDDEPATARSVASVDVVQAEVAPSSALSHAAMAELWEQEFRSARRRLEPEGALTGATRELQAALGTFLSTCHEHGVKVGPWRLQHVVAEWPFGEHPTYGVVTLAHWACKDGQPWRVGVGLFLARGAGKPKDLEVKLAVMEIEPLVVDHLILLRPEDDLGLSGKSKALWSDAERRGKHARLEPVALDGFAWVSSFPRWLASVRESLPDGAPLPNLADLIQEKAEGLLTQVCMPVN